MIKIASFLLTFLFGLVITSLSSSVLAQTVDLTEYLAPSTPVKVTISSGEVFYSINNGNEIIQCKKEDCSNYQKLFVLPNGFGLQGEDYWNDENITREDYTFQYRLDNGEIAPWLPLSMDVGSTYKSPPLNVVGYFINPDGSTTRDPNCGPNCGHVAGVEMLLDELGPMEFYNGVKFESVAKFVVTGGPGKDEVFYFAKGIGWIGWEGRTGINLPSSSPIPYNGPATKAVFTCQPTSSINSSSRPAECAMCNKGGTTPDCATTFSVNDTVEILKKQGYECEGQYYVPKTWGGGVNVTANDVTIPFVGKKGQEDEMKYLADYFEGTDEYYRAYKDGSPYQLDTINFAGVNRKLTPMEYQNQVKATVLARVNSKTVSNPISDYPVRYKERVCWDLPFAADVFLTLIDKMSLPGLDLPIIGGIINLLKSPLVYAADRSHFCVYENKTTASAGNCPLIDGVLVYECVPPRVACDAYCCENQAACDETKKSGVFTPSVSLANTAIDLYNNIPKPSFLNIAKQKTGPFEAKLSEIKTHQPPKLSDPNYEKAWEAWATQDKKPEDKYGPWYYLWSAVPLSSREDTQGRVKSEAAKKQFDTYNIDKYSFMGTFSSVPHVARLFEQASNVKKMFTSFASVLGDETTLLAQGGGSFTLGLDLKLPTGNTPGTYNMDAYMSLSNAPIGCDLSITDNTINISYSVGGGCDLVGSGGNLDQNPERINDLSSCNSPSVFMNIGSSYTINVTVHVKHVGGPNCQGWNTPFGTSCTMTLTTKGFVSSCGGATAPPPPACGLAPAPNIADCQKPAITDSNPNDSLCCGTVKANLVAQDLVINPDYTPCAEVLPDGTVRYNSDCDDTIKGIPVTRRIAVNLDQPLLKQIWDATTNPVSGIFNYFRPASYTGFSPLEAKSKDKVKYEYVDSKGNNTATPQEGNFYFPYLGGIQQAKEQTIRSLTPYVQ